jgi:hypothetical protein
VLNTEEAKLEALSNVSPMIGISPAISQIMHGYKQPSVVAKAFSKLVALSHDILRNYVCIRVHDLDYYLTKSTRSIRLLEPLLTESKLRVNDPWLD